MPAVKPNLSAAVKIEGINYDGEKNLTLNVPYKYINFEPITLGVGEELFVDIKRVDYEQSGINTFVRLWDGNVQINPNDIFYNKNYYKNESSQSKQIDIVITKVGVNDEDEPLEAGTYDVFISNYNNVDEQPLVVEYTVNKTGTYFIRRNQWLGAQDEIFPHYSLDGENFIELVPNGDREAEISLNSGDKIIIKSHPESLYRLTGENTKPLGDDSSQISGNLSMISSSSSSTTTTVTPSGETTTSTTYYDLNVFRGGVSSIRVLKWGSATTLKSQFALYGDLTSFIVDSSAGSLKSIDLRQTWAGCISLTTFPIFDTSRVTDFTRAWENCSSLTSFPLLDTSSGTDFRQTWRDCSSLTSFSLLDTSSGTNFYGAWNRCSSLTSFPQLDTSKGTNFYIAWSECYALTSFPLLDTSKGTDFGYAWYDCISLTSFPSLDVSSGTRFYGTWRYCSSLTSFPLLDTSSGTYFNSAWNGCSSLTSFPSLDVSSGTVFQNAWSNCESLTSFPSLDVSSGTDFYFAWANCFSLTSFPLIDTSKGTNFLYAWSDCHSLTSFPQLDVSSGTDFSHTWYKCSSLPHCPAGNEVTIPAGASTSDICKGI